MPVNHPTLGALPARFRRERILIIGCGDIGLRVAKNLGKRVKLLALTSQTSRTDELRNLGITPIIGDLDQGSTLGRLAGLATRLIHLAPPGKNTDADSRTRALLAAVRLRRLPVALVYASTSGVYGNCDGEWVSETRTINPKTSRAKRRADAEQAVRLLGRRRQARVSMLRIPGIYGQDREGGTPHGRLLRALPLLEANDDIYTNHIEANDLARICCSALWRGAPQRAYNVNDDTCLKMGDYFDLAADLYGLPRSPRITRAAASAQLSAMQLSFMDESRRMVNTRMKQELRVQLRFPTVLAGLSPRAGLSPT